ncbi:60S acidic ribosomal protein P1-beta [Lachancea thermotolerans]|uniref:KLTH0A05434p n=1 Tax=Lachancea thermotolerans (strain ATCC 56472 / CBS 6340 / NRRL Y-8284) TaxID=559295 RepID=C5DBU5_LACTC|nr:60S acidic ribosomal protein P1 [Lachancea thermotolerans CBS 6340]CAR21252.1 KLTH0A05434p [Lachancea thermotolerans CBS 6340]
MSDAVISYASLILADAGLDITADSLTTLTKAAGASIDNIWAETFAKALEGKDLKEILSGFHAAGSAAPAAGSASAAAAGGDAAAEEAAPEEAAEESDDDMGFGLFD